MLLIASSAILFGKPADDGATRDESGRLIGRNGKAHRSQTRDQPHETAHQKLKNSRLHTTFGADFRRFVSVNWSSSRW